MCHSHYATIWRDKLRFLHLGLLLNNNWRTRAETHQLLHTSAITSDLRNLHVTSVLQPHHYSTDRLPELTSLTMRSVAPSGVATKFSQGVRYSNYLQSSTYLYCFWTTANIMYCLLVLAQVFSEAPPTTRRNQKARFQNSNRLKLSTNVLEVMR